ncbi:hypothetical protein PQR62_00005 [Herbaspirillum lusitanum]|uniref:ABC transporter n=1 Tax=Herbaspirillum lusitanum TaxID=213312 RepID=A0ABW9A2T6_9BURK
MNKTSIRMIMLVLAAAAGFQVQAQTAPAAPAGDQPLSMKYDAVANDIPFAPLKNACAIRMLPVVDARPNKETLGANFGAALLSGDAAAWSADALQNLSQFGFKVETIKVADGRPGLTLLPQITRAYTWQIGVKLFGTVVVKVDYLKPDGSVESKTYRASGNKINMWGADYEFMTTLNYAFNNLLRTMASDVEKRCAKQA